MPNFIEVLNELKTNGADPTRAKYLTQLHQHTNRNIICYYSGWLQKPEFNTGIDDDDKNSFMTVINKLDRSKGLDLILHTPGGNVVATESLIEYIMTMFNNDVRAIVPQLSMSSGTILACACKSIVMGKQSSLGPIDPSLGIYSCSRILREFKTACLDVSKNPMNIEIWKAIISKYPPTLLTQCQDSIELTKEICTNFLKLNMLRNSPKKASRVVKNLLDSNKSKEPGRHRGIEYCKKIGLNIEDLENDDTFQDLVLTLHHIYMLILGNGPAYKIIENHKQTTLMKNARPPLPPQS